MNHSQKHTLRLVPRQQPVQQPVTPLNDLARHQEDRVHERFELHPQQSTLLRAMNFLVTRVEVLSNFVDGGERKVGVPW
jgi:hypothetical protein